MDLDLIERMMRMLEASNLEELDVTEGGMRIRLAKRRSHSEEVSSAEKPAESETTDPAAEAGEHIIRAGIAGTFYRARSPGEAPFVTEGSLVKDGEPLAIIEAMKMFNPVECDRSGTILAILCADGEPVEPGAALFSLEITPHG